MATKEGSLRYYADTLKMGKATVNKLGKEACEKKVQELRQCQVLEPSSLEVCDYPEINHLIEELKSPVSTTNNDPQKFADAMDSLNKRIQIEASIYLYRFLTGQLVKSEKDLMVANISLKCVKSFSKRPSTKSVKKASITNKTRTTKTLTTEVQEEKSLDLDNDV